LKAQKTHCKK